MASKTTGTKKNAKQSTAKKRQPTKKTSAKSAKSAKTTRKNTTSKAVPQEESFLATEILIWVTHDMDSANYADRIVYMEDGALR